MHQITLDHSFDAAHRVLGHDGKCARLHGHTYRVVVEIGAEVLVYPAFVLDFGVIKREIDRWDHRTLLWSEDPLSRAIPPDDGLIVLSYNPTSELLVRDLCARLYALVEERNGFCTVRLGETPQSSSRCTMTSGVARKDFVEGIKVGEARQ